MCKTFCKKRHNVQSVSDFLSVMKSYFITRCLFIFSCLVIGALIGKQEGRNIEVMNSFELLSHTIDDRVHIDKEYYYTKEEQCEFFLY